MGDIKIREKVKDIKSFDRAANASAHMKEAFVKSKEAVQSADRQAGQAQDAGYGSPSEYAADKTTAGVRNTAERTAHTLRQNPVKQAVANVDKAKRNFKEAERQINKARNAAKKPGADAPKKEMVKRAKQTAQRTRQTAKKSIKAAGKAEKSIKTAGKTVKDSAKMAQKGVKTAERTARVTVKTAQRTVQATGRAAQAAAKTAKIAVQASRAAAKAAATAAKVAVKATIAMVKAAILALKELVAIIAAGGWIAVAVILVICLIGLLVGSVFGIFFSGEDSGNGRTMPAVVSQLTADFYSQIEEIKGDNPHDVAIIDAMAINWRDVLAVYAVKINTNPDNGMEIATMNDEKVELLRGVLNDMVRLNYATSSQTQQRIVLNEDGDETTEEVEVVVLAISMAQKTADEIAAEYAFSRTQKGQLSELLSPDYASLWAALIGSYVAGDGAILTGDTSRIPTGIFSWPLEGGYVNSYYGWRPDPFDPEQTVFHGGLDMPYPQGTPILAAAGGTVVIANATDAWGGGYGYYVKIQHDGTFATLYAHCSQIAVTNGQEVQKGQVIGYVGSTGHSTGNHLHWEVYVNGARVDPLGFFT